MKIVTFLMLCIFSLSSFSQDERFYRSIFNGEVFKKNKVRDNYRVEVKSPRYMIDLNRDGVKESIQTLKRDGLDYIRVNNARGSQVFLGKLSAKGSRSRIFRADFKNISKGVDVLILHYYEGHNQTGIFEGTGRLYFATILERNLEKISLTKGPFFWMEKEKGHGKYLNRRYSVNTIDYNLDGKREISVTFNKIHRIYVYADEGLWQKF